MTLAPLPHADVIGDPIIHSKSPVIHGFWLEQLGLAGSYGRVHVRAADLPRYLADARNRADWRGCNVTLPHKEAVIPLIDRVDPAAAAVGAVNTIIKAPDHRLTGRNTDVDGVAEALAGTDVAGRVAVVIGAGGAARAAFAHLAHQRCASVRVLARQPEKAVAAAAACGLAVDARPMADCADVLDGASFLINATQLGMAGQDAMPGAVLAALSGMARDARVFDMVYVPLATALLQAARAQGLATADGLTMLIGQAAAAFAHFYGQAAPRDGDAALRARLRAA